MKKKTNKSSKLRDFKCVICGNEFKNYLAPSDIKKGKGKVCSKKCKNILTGNQKRKSFLKKCIVCNKDFWCRPSENIIGKHYKQYCSKVCYKNRPLLKDRIGGNFISSDGYVVLMIKGKQIKEHRYLIELQIGRKLKSNEIVHHIDGNKLNNKLENLQLVTRSEHNKIHFKINDGLTNIQRFKRRHFMI